MLIHRYLQRNFMLNQTDVKQAVPTDLSNLKFHVNKLDTNKLKPVSIGFKNLNDAADSDIA